MPPTKQTTIHFDESLHQALRRKAAETHRSISDLVNGAVRDALREIADDLADFDARATEPVVGVDVFVRKMTRRPEMALRLSRLFSNSAEFWLNAQRAVDLHDAEQAIRKEVARITPLRVA